MRDKEFARVVKSLEKTPETIKQLVSGFPNWSLTLKPSSTGFSILEHICHLRDIEQEGYAVRIERLLTEVDPFLPDIDGNKLAAERAYNQQDFHVALSQFTLTRDNNVQLLQGVTVNQLSRGGILDKVGSITLERLPLMMRTHDQEHLNELNELLGRLAIDQ